MQYLIGYGEMEAEALSVVGGLAIVLTGLEGFQQDERQGVDHIAVAMSLIPD